ncbi:MAG: redoxin domain-containing protein [Hydrogenophilaceae bacterium]|jgi:thiol-disulfide isomerase/thioredoxin|nr:redoxin domain-containing protein [Hydrogenophilaceae bacterium]
MLLALMLFQQSWAGKAVNFVLTDNKGKVHRLSDYSGKWVLINFWAPWCPRCWMEFPLLNDLDSRKDFVVLGIAMDYGGDEASVLTYANRYNLRYPQIFAGNRRDQNSPSHQIGPVDFYPTSYLYAPDGELVMFIPGIVSKTKLASFMDQYSRDNPTMFAAAPVAPGVSQALPSAEPAASAGDNKTVPSAVKPAQYKKAPVPAAKKKVSS